MDKRLQLIAYLYDEDLEGLEPLGSLLLDPELRQEYEALAEARFRLERRQRTRPDPILVNRIVENALAGSRPGVRVDRPALRLVSSRRAWIPALAVAASVLFVVIVRPWQSANPETLAPLAEMSGKAIPAAPDAESLLVDLPPAPPATLASAEPSGDTEWDTGDDLRSMSRRIAVLRDIPIDAWDGPAVPLEAIPSGTSDLVTPAGATRPRF